VEGIYWTNKGPPPPRPLTADRNAPFFICVILQFGHGDPRGDCADAAAPSYLALCGFLPPCRQCPPTFSSRPRHTGPFEPLGRTGGVVADRRGTCTCFFLHQTIPSLCSCGRTLWRFFPWLAPCGSMKTWVLSQLPRLRLLGYVRPSFLPRAQTPRTGLHAASSLFGFRGCRGVSKETPIPIQGSGPVVM